MICGTLPTLAICIARCRSVTSLRRPYQARVNLPPLITASSMFERHSPVL